LRSRTVEEPVGCELGGEYGNEGHVVLHARGRSAADLLHELLDGLGSKAPTFETFSLESISST
jgi:hypothetical protein